MQEKSKKEGKALFNTLCEAGMCSCGNRGTNEVCGLRGPCILPARPQSTHSWLAPSQRPPGPLATSFAPIRPPPG